MFEPWDWQVVKNIFYTTDYLTECILCTFTFLVDLYDKKNLNKVLDNRTSESLLLSIDPAQFTIATTSIRFILNKKCLLSFQSSKVNLAYITRSLVEIIIFSGLLSWLENRWYWLINKYNQKIRQKVKVQE